MCVDAYQKTIQALLKAHVSSPRLEARMLIAHVLNLSCDEICSKTTLTSADDKKLQSLLNKRLQGMPIDKILGLKEFYKYPFIVSEDVLSPRPDTETLLLEAIKTIEQNHLYSISD